MKGIRRNNKGFTLIELLIVIVIIGILATVIIITLSGARAKAQDTQIKNNVSGIKTTLEQYKQDKGIYPTNYESHDGRMLIPLDHEDREGTTPLRDTLAPYLGAGAGSGIFTGYMKNVGGATPTNSYATNFLVNSSYVVAAGLNSTDTAFTDSTDNAAPHGNGVYDNGIRTPKKDANSTYTSCNDTSNDLVGGVCIYNNGVAISAQADIGRYGAGQKSRAFVVYGPQ